MRVNRFKESYERRRRLEGERALKELEAENERLRSKIVAMEGKGLERMVQAVRKLRLYTPSDRVGGETTFCNRMRKEGLV